MSFIVLSAVRVADIVDNDTRGIIDYQVCGIGIGGIGYQLHPGNAIPLKLPGKIRFKNNHFFHGTLTEDLCNLLFIFEVSPVEEKAGGDDLSFISLVTTSSDLSRNTTFISFSSLETT